MPARVKFVTIARSLAAACLAASLAAACQTRPSQAPAKKVDAAPVAAPRPTPPPPAGPYHVLAPLADTAAFDACGDDTDCVVAPLRCCECARGGLGVAVARSKVGEWPGGSCAADAPPCDPTPTDDPTCRAAPRCLNGHCRLTVRAAELSPAPPAPSPGNR